MSPKLKSIIKNCPKIDYDKIVSTNINNESPIKSRDNLIDNIVEKSSLYLKKNLKLIEKNQMNKRCDKKDKENSNNKRNYAVKKLAKDLCGYIIESIDEQEKEEKLNKICDQLEGKDFDGSKDKKKKKDKEKVIIALKNIQEYFEENSSNSNSNM